MRGIFISYRRDDAEGQAGRLFDDLSAHFGCDAVFMDVAGIKKGMDFRRIIDEHVTSCGVLLVIIGKRWLSATDGKGRRRLDDANDFVRLETAAALTRDIPVVPVLVQDAVMPTEQELPDILKELAFRNGTELTHARWDSDVKLLIEDVRPYLETRGMPVAPTQPTGNPSSDAAESRLQSAARNPGRLSLWVTAGAAAFLVGVALSSYHLMRDRPAAHERTATVVSSSPTAPSATAAVRKPDITSATSPTAVKAVAPAADEPAKPEPGAAQTATAKPTADKATADAAQVAAKAAAARKLAEDRRRREETARLAQLSEEQRKFDEQRRRDEENKRLAEEQRKRDEENKRLAQERAERERIAAEQAAAASFITGIASALIANKQNNRR
jgi:hypothetical protein